MKTMTEYAPELLQWIESNKVSAESYPDQKFAIIDSTYEEIPSNVRPITFNEEQAGYTTGLIASQMTKNNVVGFIGGLDIPSCSNFGVGFEKAIKEVNKDIKVLKQFTNSFTDAAKGRVVAEQMVNEGADILFMASGGGNNGILEVVKENNIKAIGVDMPNNYLAPQHVITSALKNVGEGLKLTIKYQKPQEEKLGGKIMNKKIAMLLTLLMLTSCGLTVDDNSLLNLDGVNFTPLTSFNLEDVEYDISIPLTDETFYLYKQGEYTSKCEVWTLNYEYTIYYLIDVDFIEQDKLYDKIYESVNNNLEYINQTLNENITIYKNEQNVIIEESLTNVFKGEV